MGLDISYYKNITLDPSIIDMEKQDVYNTHVEVHNDTINWVERSFGPRTEGLSAGIYTYEHCDGFRAGSYSGYNQWREQLARFAHAKSARDFWIVGATGAFVELIHFADNEGYIGPVVSKKLANDFRENRERIFALANQIEAHGEADWFTSLYDKWTEAFTAAADNGFVDFH